MKIQDSIPVQKYSDSFLQKLYGIQIDFIDL